MQGKKHYQEKLFVNFQLSNHVPENNFYRQLRDILPLQWVYKATKKYYGNEGQQSIDPVVFFKLMLIGYLENIGSDRRIINTVQLRLDMLYFIGYDIDETLPWHSTLSRTRQLYGDDVFKELFKKVLGLCIDKGMVSGKRQAIDSVPVQANASMESLKRKEVLNDVVDYTNSLVKDEATIEDNSKSESKSVSNSEVVSTTDSDARVSVKPGKARRLNYFAQVSVDTASHVITHIQSEYADKKDSQSLPSLVQNTMDNLKEHSLNIEEILADGNYSSSEALRFLEHNNLVGYIPNFGQYKPTRDGFIYDKENNSYQCVEGKILHYKGMKVSHHGNGTIMKQYRSSSRDCKYCPLKAKCIAKASYKTIAVTTDNELFEKMHERLKSPEAAIMKKLRSSTVEPVLGTLVNYLNMRRLNTKGIKLAGKCMMLAAIAYNLKKLVKRAQKSDIKYILNLYRYLIDIASNGEWHFDNLYSCIK